SPAGVQAVEPRSAAGVEAALAAVLPLVSGGRGAVKVGMVGTSDLAEAIGQALAGFAGPVVFDPVLGASSGGALYGGAPAGLDALIRRATLVTPNLGEAAVLAGMERLESLDDARAAAQRLRARGAAAVLVKGGHGRGETAEDLL